MTRTTMSDSRWKTLLITVWLLFMALNVWASIHADRRWDSARAGTIGAVLGPADRDYRYPIISMVANSPLAAAGAKAGDTLVFDHFGDRQRNLARDEVVGATLFAAGRAAPVQLRAIGDPNHQPAISVVLESFAVYVGLVCALLIGLRRADSVAMRILSVVLLCYGLGTQIHDIPGGLPFDLFARFVLILNGAIAYIFFAYFTLIFPEDRPLLRFKVVRLLFLAFFCAFLALTATRIAINYGVLPWPVRELISIRTWAVTQYNTSVSLSLAALLFSWYHSAGLTRQKLAWITVSMGVQFATFQATSWNRALGSPIPDLALMNALSIIQALSGAALVYALLRHRLFDFGFAVNRALVVTIISTLLLIVFSLTEWGVDKFLHFEGRQKNAIFDAAVALAIILSFHRIQHWVNHKVDHVFFHHWYSAAEKLRQFMHRAAHITDAAAVQNKFISAVEEFSSTDGVAIFRLDASGDFAAAHASLRGVPAIVDRDDDVLIAMRSSRKFVFLSDCGKSLPGEIAFPLMVRGSVNGLVLIGAKQGGQQYRPDEIALLETCVQQIGLDLEGLRAIELQDRAMSSERHAAHLEQRLADLERTCAAQDHALRLSAGNRAPANL